MGRPRIRPIPSVGSKYGAWEIVSPGGKKCLCRCMCGNENHVYNYDLLDGKSLMCNSCANSHRGSIDPRPHKRAFPKMDREMYYRLRYIAARAIQRCTNINNTRYESYGGRGIKVCEEWLNNISAFVEYLITLEGYDNTSLLLDRINNEGHYEPGNLRFVTSSVSARNRRNKLMKNGRRCYVGEYRIGG